MFNFKPWGENNGIRAQRKVSHVQQKQCSSRQGWRGQQRLTCLWLLCLRVLVPIHTSHPSQSNGEKEEITRTFCAAVCSLTSTGAENETQKYVHVEFLTQLVERFNKQLDGRMNRQFKGRSHRKSFIRTNLCQIQVYQAPAHFCLLQFWGSVCKQAVLEISPSRCHKEHWLADSSPCVVGERWPPARRSSEVWGLCKASPCSTSFSLVVTFTFCTSLNIWTLV